MMRKIIQINTNVYKDSQLITALCNDGTLWERINTNGQRWGNGELYYEWKQLESIPQPPIDDYVFAGKKVKDMTEEEKIEAFRTTKKMELPREPFWPDQGCFDKWIEHQKEFKNCK